MRFMDKQNSRFRVLALTATPGSTTGAIQDVVSVLKIEHVEYRDDQSPDVVKYINTKVIPIKSGPVQGETSGR